VQVRLIERHLDGNVLLFEGRGRNGGLEISDDMAAAEGIRDVRTVQGLARP